MQNIFVFAFILFSAAMVLAYMAMAKKGSLDLVLRKVAGLDAIEEAVGRATELGASVHFGTGISMITDAQAPQTLAALDVMSYTASLSARYGTPLITSMGVAETLPMHQETLKNEYVASGRPELYNEDSVRFLPGQWGWASGVTNILNQENVAASLLLGSFYSEALLAAEAGNTVGCIQIAGTASAHQLPFFVATCDYVLIGDELYVAGAYLSQDPAKMGSIVAQDYIKIAIIALAVTGVVLETLGYGTISRLLRM